MKSAPLTLRWVLFLLLGWATLGPGMPAVQAAGAASDASRAASYASPGTTTSAVVPANKLFDYIRGNRARMVQVATIGLVIGLIILMTATRKH